jgi:hypothetical protein
MYCSVQGSGESAQEDLRLAEQMVLKHVSGQDEGIDLFTGIV